MKQRTLYRYSQLTLATNVLVILWGAYVRASGAGAGCGKHWPLCNGVVVPLAPAHETIIEFTHRLTSGLAFMMVLGLLVVIQRSYREKDRLIIFSRLAMFFMILEASIGAGLVLLELVAYNTSVLRAVVGSLHLLNTFLLLAMLTLVIEGIRMEHAGSIEWKGARALFLGFGMFGFLLVGMSGAIAALGDTLFPSDTLFEGLLQDFSANAHFLVRLRVWHPVIAVVASSLVYSGMRIPGISGASAVPLQRVLISLMATQLVAGVVNVLLLAPIWMQITHLLLADAIWIGTVLYAYQTQRRPAAEHQSRSSNIS